MSQAWLYPCPQSLRTTDSSERLEMRVMTVLGTRPEIIRLSRTIDLLDRVCEHTLVHTGQNFDQRLSDLFFSELRLRTPDLYLGVKAPGFAGQVAQIIEKVDEAMRVHNPDRLLLLGDTNSALSALAAKRRGIPVYHMEAGNRCFDDRVPEEINRRVIDHTSDVLMPYTERSRQNLLREGIASDRIFVTGNPINEVMKFYASEIDSSSILDELELTAGQYFLVTVHRAENVDDKSRLASILSALDLIAKEFGLPIIVSTHPRTRQRLPVSADKLKGGLVKFMEPFGFFDFLKLEQNAKCVLTDSGTVQEECCILGIPNVTLRDNTERPETIEAGSNILSGVEPDFVLRCVRLALIRIGDWKPPAEYAVAQVSGTACSIITGFHKSSSSHSQLLDVRQSFEQGAHGRRS